MHACTHPAAMYMDELTNTTKDLAKPCTVYAALVAPTYLNEAVIIF